MKPETTTQKWVGNGAIALCVLYLIGAIIYVNQRTVIAPVQIPEVPAKLIQ